MLDGANSTKFLTCWVSLQSSHANFQKKISLTKNGGHFEFFAKIAKHKNAYISKTVLDTVISTKLLTRRVSLLSSHANCQKNFVSPKMAAILNFRIFFFECLYLENRARWSELNKILDLLGISAE